MENGEIVIYQPNEITRLEVMVKDETVWLNRLQMSLLFDRDVKTIGKHINNALREELRDVATVANFAIVQKEGERYVSRNIDYYSLDMILSVGYRVKSETGIIFRRWANSVLKEYIIKGISINLQNTNISLLDQRIINHDKRITDCEKKIDFFIKTSLPPKQGIFYNGQIYDAYSFVSSLIRKATKRIILIDNYIDDTVLTLIDKRQDTVSATIYTNTFSKQLKLDLSKHNSQYSPITVRIFSKAHDRFLIIDDEVYLIGASIKDLGKKWFGFTLMENSYAQDIIDKLNE